jgi:hypothetical protein
VVQSNVVYCRGCRWRVTDKYVYREMELMSSSVLSFDGIVW